MIKSVKSRKQSLDEKGHCQRNPTDERDRLQTKYCGAKCEDE